jgi:hypothetical protein
MFRTLLALLLLALLLFPAVASADDQHAFICADSGLRKIMIFSPEGQVVWEHEGVYSYDVNLLPNGNILFAGSEAKGSSVVEMTRDKKVVFEFKTEGEVFSCERLKNGNTLIGCCTASKLLEVAPDGGVVKTIPLTSDAKGHAAMRWARITPWGTYLVAHTADKVVREYNDKAEVVREIEAPDLAFGVVPLPNKNILISTETEIIEVTPDDKVVWRLTGKDIPEAGAAWLAGIRRLPNGNTLVCNWLGHGKEGTGYPLFEVTPDKKIV